PVGKAQLRRRGQKVAILSFGVMLDIALEVGEQLDATVVNMRFIKPIDADMILQLAAEHDLLVTIDENVVVGGAGTAVSEVFSAHNRPANIVHYGLPDDPIQHGSREDMLNAAGLTTEAFRAFIQQYLPASTAPASVARN
ncbi:MAG: transketolase C-terminal domain-containing protein, partial [Gammaproteobacteria bacterium]